LYLTYDSKGMQDCSFIHPPAKKLTEFHVGPIKYCQVAICQIKIKKYV